MYELFPYSIITFPFPFESREEGEAEKVLENERKKARKENGNMHRRYDRI